MTQAAEIVFWTVIGLLVSQVALGSGFILALRRFRRPALADRECPPATIVLCLRGPDPFLPDCIRALANQDYPRYDVRIIIDDVGDPAWEMAERTLRKLGATNVQIEPLSTRRSTCSLKCSSLLQAVAGLDDACQIVALADADTVPHRTWLRELAGALADPRVGAATGNRWYMPADAGWGGLVRYLWNAAAIVQMYWYRIAWGGTLAIKRSVLRETDLMERWSKAFCEDTMLYKALRPHKLRVDFVPSLMMINRESCDVPGYFSWVRRQMLTARLYHPRWINVVAYGVVTSIALAAAVVLLFAGAATANTAVLTWTGGALACYLVTMLAMLTPMEAAVRTITRSRGEPANWTKGRTLLRIMLAIPLTQAIYAAVIASTMLVRRVEWRGVEYRIGGPWLIELVEYRPYEVSGRSADAVTSL